MTIPTKLDAAARQRELLEECYKFFLDAYDRGELSDAEVRLMGEIQAIVEGRP